MTAENSFIPYTRESYEGENLLKRAQEFYVEMNERRSIRDFSDKLVPRKVMEQLVLAASTAPSGANKQPYTFALVSDTEIKMKIREAAEKEEYINYSGRMSEQWRKDLQPLGTNEIKPFLEKAPWLIVIFKKVYDAINEEKRNNYYVNESVGIAAGFLLTAIHHAGLVALTHTPSPMNFLCDILKRPENERPFLLIPVGYPAENATVPDLKRKNIDELAVFYEPES